MSDYFNGSGTIGFTCDNCGRELLGCTWVNGMKFCAKCYQETFGASKDWQLLDKDKTIAEQRKQIADLETKLAEKDELIGILKNKYECADRELYLTKDTLKHHTNIYNSLVESKDQDKISFAVEKLNYFKVLRDLILNMRMTSFEEFRNKIPMKYLAIVDAHIEKLADIVDDQVDYQIQQLTHQHEDKGETNGQNN